MGEPSEPPPSVPKVSAWSYFNRPVARLVYIVGIALVGWWRYEVSQPNVQVGPPVRVIDVPPGALLGRRPPEPEWDAGPPADADIDPARLRVTFGGRGGYLLHGRFVPDAVDGGAENAD